MKYDDVEKLKHEPYCAFVKGDEYCDCGAIESALTSRITELEHLSDRLIAEISAWQSRFPEYFYELESNSIIKD